MAVLCGLTGRPFYFTGTRTLQIKETDRILALDNELQKLGIHISYDQEGKWISWDGRKRSIPSTQFSINTYQDHRMAMAFAPLAMVAACPMGLAPGLSLTKSGVLPYNLSDVRAGNLEAY